jgi:hypothetical protein
MRTAILTLLFFATAAPASAFERMGGGVDAMGAAIAHEPHVPPVRRAGRTLAAFELAEREITVGAYGRRARARLNGDAEGLRHARAMGKVFDGAPQPALVTLEFSVKF